ncbi:MAG: LysE family translocator [Gammaproteobacteria bacterium]|nr:LysE family translocator [Gammaproteobacteria bacterium]
MNETQILMFALTSMLVILSPGQDMVLVISRGITQGAKAGIVTAAGVSTGLIGHTALAAVGVGALLTAADGWFMLVKWVGAAYLFYLGLRLIFSKPAMDVRSPQLKSYRKMFSQGALSNITNPKITVFYFAFLPQFISAEIQNPTAYLLILGIGFSLLTVLIKVPIGYFAGLAAHWIGSRPGIIQNINRVSGSVLIGFGLKLAADNR